MSARGGGSPGPYGLGVSRPTPGGSPALPPMMATAASGTHPTGMHYCSLCFLTVYSCPQPVRLALNLSRTDFYSHSMQMDFYGCHTFFKHDNFSLASLNRENPKITNYLFITARKRSLRRLCFTRVCLSIYGRAWQGAHCHPRRYYEIRSMSGRYASYWNAFLLLVIISDSW